MCNEILVNWRAIAQKKRAAQAELIPSEVRVKNIPDGLVNAVEYVESCGLLSDEELQLTRITDARVLDKVVSGALTSTKIASAFIKRTAILQQLTGCCTEIFFDRALERAQILDRHLAETGKPIGPLHGLPVSVKDGFDVGWVGLVDTPAPKNGRELEVLLQLGAVIYCKTNIPQSLLMSDSYNHVFGQSVNPFNRNLISGGSSGGEGALVGGRGSILGMGTDIGGSVRIPACLQGLYSLCPTTGRVPFLKSARDQEYIVPPVAGPLTHNLSTLEYYLDDSHLSTSPWDVDPRAFPIPWRKELAEPPKKPLKLAYIFDDGVVKPQPPVARIMREAVEKLKAVGREFIEWDTSLHKEGVRLWYEAVLAGGGKGCRDKCALIGEPLIQGMVVGEEKNFLDIPERQKVRHHDQLSVAKLQYEKAFLAQWRAHLPRNDSDRFNHEQYNIDLVNGMPVGLQIVTGRFGEEKAVAVAKVLEGLPVKR